MQGTKESAINSWSFPCFSMVSSKQGITQLNYDHRNKQDKSLSLTHETLYFIKKRKIIQLQGLNKFQTKALLQFPFRFRLRHLI